MNKNRESQILDLLVAGASNKKIAHDLGICEATVKTHLRIFRAKWGADNRCELVALYVQSKEAVLKQ